MAKKNTETGGCFLTIGIICIVVFMFGILNALFKEIAYQFKHNTENALGITFMIGLVSIGIYKALNSE